MIYHLVEFLKGIGIDLPGQGLFGYLSFRAMAAFTTALLISIFAGRKIIRWIQKKQIGEEIRDLGLEGQMQKKGTPTMGGIIIFISIIVPILLFGDLTNIYNILLLVSTVWFFLIGFADDYIKVFKKNKEGMSAKMKLAGQGLMGLAIGLAVCFNSDIVVRENVQVSETVVIEALADSTSIDHAEMQEVEKMDVIKSTKTTIPFIKNHNLDYSEIMSFCGDYKEEAGWALFVLITIFVVTAVSNGANLNDGMDGMLAGNAAIIGIALALLAYVSSHVGWAEYLNIMFLPGAEEIVVFAFAFIGALIGFLWYNAFPAQVFMGDTGSLTIGGIIGVIAILIHKEILLVLLCGVFVAENLSVMTQVAYYKRGKRKGVKQRLFRRAPLHHHYNIGEEKLDKECSYLFKGPERPLHEAKITLRFWIVTIVMAVITLMTLKIR